MLYSGNGEQIGLSMADIQDAPELEALGNAFDVAPVILNGVDKQDFHAGLYAAYPYKISTSFQWLSLYDADKNVITAYDSNGNAVGRPDIGYTFMAVDRAILLIDDSTIVEKVYISMDEYNNDAPHATQKYTLSATPVYIKTNRSYNKVFLESVDNNPYWFKFDGETYIGFLQQTSDYAQDVVSERFESRADLNRRVKDAAIQEMNRARDAFRIGTFNIYSAGHGQKNWDCLREMLQNYGLDFVGTQETRDPLGTIDGNKVFADEMRSWQFQHFSTNGDLYPTNERSLMSRYPVVSSTEWGFEKWSSDRRCCAKYEVLLPRRKDRVGSEQIKMSIYNTQLEVYPTSGGNATNRLSETQEIIDAIAEDTNPFVVVVMDSNDFSPDKETWKLLEDAGFTPAIPVSTQTVRDQDNCIDQIFVNSRMESLNYDVINANDYKFFSGGAMQAVSDHDLCFADVRLNYDFWCIKQSLTNVTSDFAGVWIEQDKPLTIHLTAGSGYSLSKVKVRMGADDVTADRYSNGTVTLPNVTGDVYIIATGG